MFRIFQTFQFSVIPLFRCFSNFPVRPERNWECLSAPSLCDPLGLQSHVVTPCHNHTGPSNLYHKVGNMSNIEPAMQNTAGLHNKFIVLSYRRCSNCRPPAAMHAFTRLRKLPTVFSSTSRGIVAHAVRIRAIISARVLGGRSYTTSFRYPHKKKSGIVMSGERGGQGTGPPRPIHRPGKVAFK